MGQWLVLLVGSDKERVLLGLIRMYFQLQRLNVCKLVQIDNEFIVFGQVHMRYYF